MSINKSFSTILLVGVSCLLSMPVVDLAADGKASAKSTYPQALPVEPIPRVETLPETYPDSWVFALDLNFASLLDGKIVVVDVAASDRNYKGLLSSGIMGNFKVATTRPELYTTMTVYSRLTYGERTDVLVIYDKRTLLPIGEIVLPTKRQQVVTQQNSFQLLGDERLGLIMNFTPATSVTVVDLVERKVVGEVSTPGCNFIFPTGDTAFSSLCADGAMVTYVLDEKGAVTSQHRSKQFIDIQNDPLFIKNAQVGGIHYFPSFQGRMQEIDFRGDEAQILSDWNFIPEALQSENWRPSGWQIIGASEDELFVVMAPDGVEGSHKNGGSEVWVLDPAAKKLVRRLTLPNGGLSIALTRGNPSLLVVTNALMALDVLDSKSGELQRTISLGDAATPFVVQVD